LKVEDVLVCYPIYIVNVQEAYPSVVASDKIRVPERVRISNVKKMMTVMVLFVVAVNALRVVHLYQLGQW
jgi:hypothetical protein